MLRRLTVLITAIFLLISLAGCVYKLPIEQGNIITPEMLDQIKVGMSRRQVEAILGSPILENIYQNGHVIYVYTFYHSRKTYIKHRLIIYFSNNRMTHYTTDYGETKLPNPN